MQKFTVIGFYESNGQIFSFHVEAENALQAFAVAADDSDKTFVCALPGHIDEGIGAFFPGAGLVDSDTIVEQSDVFGDDE